MRRNRADGEDVDPAQSGPGGPGLGSNRFQSTHWSVVLAAGGENRGAAEAMEALCRAYWLPVYAFIRGRGYGYHDAQDATQDFLSRFVAAPGLKTVAPERGRFRSYILASLKNYLANEWHRENRAKRGGGKVIVSLEALRAAEGGLPIVDTGIHADANESPDALAEATLDREWAKTTVDLAVRRLRQEADKDGSSERFAVLVQFLPGAREARPYEEAAEELGVSVAAVKSAIHRLRRRFAELFRAEILQTVASADDCDDEIRHLFQALVG